MKINNLSNNELLKYIYAFIKINKQDINKCNILICKGENFSDFDFVKTLQKSCIYYSKKFALKNHNCKIKVKNILKSFNYRFFNNLSEKTLKNYTLLGNFDVGVKFNNNSLIVCAGNGYMLAKQKQTEFLCALTEFDNLSCSEIIKFFKIEKNKQSVLPLNLYQIKNRQSELKNMKNLVNNFYKN